MRFTTLLNYHLIDDFRDLFPFLQFKKRKKIPVEECYF